MARKPDAHHVVDAVASRTGDIETSSKKRRKRKEKDLTADDEDRLVIDDSNAHSLESTEHRRKKKKKKHGPEKASEEPVATPIPHEEHATSVAGTNATVENTKEKKKKKKKKKRKDRQREQQFEQHLEPNIDPSLTGIDGNSGASASAFLSAIVTAAGAEPVAQEQPNQTSFAQQASYLRSPGLQNLPSGFTGPPASFSGEDIARVLQGLDVARLADALQALGEAGSGTFPLPGQSVQNQPTGSSLQHLPPPQPAFNQNPRTQPIIAPVSSVPRSAQGQVAAPSAVILSQPPGNQEHHPIPQNAAPVTSPIHLREDHAHLLANKWLPATKLNELTKTIGLQYKKGKFSASEEALLHNAIENYRMRNGLTHEQLNELIFAKGVKDKDNAFWFEITSHVPLRPVVAVYHHVKRAFHPLKQQGKWTPAEDDTLRQAVAELGQAWEKVSQRVGRMAGDCRDRWRNYVNNREGRVQGPWSKEEEDRLTQIVTDLTTAQGRNPDWDVFWTQVAARMGTRGRQQCRIKWTDCLSKTVKNAGQKPRWSQQDAYILVHKIASLNVNDDSEIDWKLLSDEHWNLWSAHTLQRRWLTLKHSVRGHEEMSHQEIMDILRVKKSHPPPPTTTPVKRRVTSAPIVPDEAQASDVAIEDSFHIPGSSGGFGDLHNAQITGLPANAGHSPQPDFNGFTPGLPQARHVEGIANADSGNSNPVLSNVQSQHLDEASSSSSSDSDASDSE